MRRGGGGAKVQPSATRTTYAGLFRARRAQETGAITEPVVPKRITRVLGSLVKQITTQRACLRGGAVGRSC